MLEIHKLSKVLIRTGNDTKTTRKPFIRQYTLLSFHPSKSSLSSVTAGLKQIDLQNRKDGVPCFPDTIMGAWAASETEGTCR